VEGNFSLKKRLFFRSVSVTFGGGGGWGMGEHHFSEDLFKVPL